MLRQVYLAIILVVGFVLLIGATVAYTKQMQLLALPPLVLVPPPQEPEPEVRTLEVIVHESQGYQVMQIDNLLSEEECDAMIQIARRQGLEESGVWSQDDDMKGNTYDYTHRKSKQTWLMSTDSPVCDKLSNLSVQLTNLPLSHQEKIQVAMYEPGGMFNAHYDACYHHDKGYCAQMNNNSGERRTTLLVYLNDDFQGGETEFVDIGIKIRPKRGMAILFYDTDENDEIILQSKHRGNPVTSGEKWICTVWSHSKEYKD